MASKVVLSVEEVAPALAHLEAFLGVYEDAEDHVMLRGVDGVIEPLDQLDDMRQLLEELRDVLARVVDARA